MINNFLLAKSLDHIGESLPKVVVACTKRTAENQYYQIWLHPWFASSLLYDTWTKLVYFEFVCFHKQNTQVLTVSMEMVYMAESRPSNNQSECLDLPQNYLTK